MAINTYLTKSGELRHQVQVWSKGRRIKTKSFKRKVDAKEWLKREELKALDRAVGRKLGDSITVDEFFKNNYWPQKDIRESTAVDYSVIYRKFICPQVGTKKMAELTTEDWIAFFQELRRKGVSAARANRIRALASALYSSGIKWRYFSINPVSAVGLFEEDLPKLQYWNLEEARHFLSWAKINSPLFPVYHLAYETGLRRGEIQALKRDCVDVETGTITVRANYSPHTKKITQTTKGGAGRIVGLASSLRQTLGDHLSTHEHDLVFTSPDGSVLTHDSIRQRFFRDQKKAGVRRIRFHDLRHTFASHFVMNGGNLYDLRQLLGHSSVETTARYAHLSPSHLVAQASLVTFEPAA